MDPGSSAASLDPHGALDQFASQRRGGFANLRSAQELADTQIQAATADLADVAPDGVSVVMFGSWARRELADGSDNDWAILTPEGREHDDDVQQLSCFVAVRDSTTRGVAFDWHSNVRMRCCATDESSEGGTMPDDFEGIGLAEALEVLRAELASAQAKAAEGDVQFPIETLTVEFRAGVTRTADGKAGFKVPLVGVEFGGAAGYDRESVQTVTLVLGAPVDHAGRPVKVGRRLHDRP